MKPLLILALLAFCSFAQVKLPYYTYKTVETFIENKNRTTIAQGYWKTFQKVASIDTLYIHPSEVKALDSRKGFLVLGKWYKSPWSIDKLAKELGW